MRFLIIIFIIINSPTYGQKQYIDSLKNSGFIKNNQIGELLRIKGIEFKNSSQYNKALSFFNSALSEFKKESDSIGIANTLNNIGIVYKIIDDSRNSLIYLKHSLEINAKIKNYEGVSKNNIALGQLYAKLNQIEPALKYLKSSIYYSTKIDNERLKCMALNSLGNIYYNNSKYKNLDSAKIYYYKSLKINSKINYVSGLSHLYNNLGLIHLESYEFNQAIICFKSALEIGLMTKNQILESKSYHNLGLLFLKSNKLDSAEYYLNKSNELAKATKNGRLLIDVYANQIRLYIRQNNTQALEAFDQYSILRDSIINEEKQIQLLDIQTKYQTQQTREQLASQLQISELRNKQLNQFKILILAIIVLALMAFYLLFLWYRHRKHLQDLEIIQIQKSHEIESLHMLQGAQEKERKRIAEDLHDNIGAKLSMVKLIISENDDHNSKKANLLLSEIMADTRKLSHELFSELLIQYGLVTAIEDLLSKLNLSKSLNIEFHHKNIDKRCSIELEKSLYLIIHELIANTIKHAKANHVMIQLNGPKSPNMQITLIYEDDGIGFNLPDDSTKGMGLRSIETRVGSFEHNMTIDSSSGNGMVFILEIHDKNIKNVYQNLKKQLIN